MGEEHNSRQKRSLWWTALVILLVCGFFAYLFGLNKTEDIGRMGARVSMAIGALGAGFCIILATADSWFKR